MESADYDEDASLWDTLCTGDNKSLWLSEEQAESVDTSPKEVIIKDVFENSAGRRLGVQLLKQHLIVTSEKVKIMHLGYVKCLWQSIGGRKSFHFTKGDE